MFEQRNWKSKELSQLQHLLQFFPERHTTYNGSLRALVREDYLERKGVVYQSVAGLYRPAGGEATLFNPAFWDPFVLGDQEIPALDFVLLTLIGFSLFPELEVKKNWPPVMYPAFDRGDGAHPQVKILDRQRLPEEIQFKKGQLELNPKLVSLDRCFAYCYACYAFTPEPLLRSFPEAYHFLKDRIFAGLEYRGEKGRFGSSAKWIRV